MSFAALSKAHCVELACLVTLIMPDTLAELSEVMACYSMRPYLIVVPRSITVLEYLL